MKKFNFLATLSKQIKEKWESNKLAIAVSIQEEIQSDEIELVDLDFDVRTNAEYSEDYDQYIFVFKVNENLVKVDYLVTEDNEISENRLLYHGLYKIHENEDNGGDVFLYEEDNPKYKAGYQLVNTLNSLSIKDILEGYLDLLIVLRNEHEVMISKAFYKENQAYLKGITSISGLLGKQVLITLESGMKIRAVKYDIEKEIIRLKNKELDNKKSN